MSRVPFEGKYAFYPSTYFINRKKNEKLKKKKSDHSVFFPEILCPELESSAWIEKWIEMVVLLKKKLKISTLNRFLEPSLTCIFDHVNVRYYCSSFKTLYFPRNKFFIFTGSPDIQR